MTKFLIPVLDGKPDPDVEPEGLAMGEYLMAVDAARSLEEMPDPVRVEKHASETHPGTGSSQDVHGSWADKGSDSDPDPNPDKDQRHWEEEGPWQLPSFSGSRADFDQAKARLAEADALYRGMAVALPDDLKARVEELLQPAMEESDIPKRYEAGRLILEHITSRGIGSHWTTNKTWAGKAADRAGGGVRPEGAWDIIVEIEPPGEDAMNPIQDSSGMTEGEVTLKAKGEYVYRSLKIEGGTWFDNVNLLEEPVAMSSRETEYRTVEDMTADRETQTKPAKTKRKAKPAKTEDLDPQPPPIGPPKATTYARVEDMTAAREEDLKKHAQHDQKSHGNWARGLKGKVGEPRPAGARNVLPVDEPDVDRRDRVRKKKLHSLQRDRLGDCYQNAGRFFLHEADEDAKLVHGIIRNGDDHVAHGWVVEPDGYIYEPTTDAMYHEDDFKELTNPVVLMEYSRADALRTMARDKHWGPYDDFSWAWYRAKESGATRSEATQLAILKKMGAA